MTGELPDGGTSGSDTPRLVAATARFIERREILDSAREDIENDYRALLNSLQMTYDSGTEVSFTGRFYDLNLDGNELNLGRESWTGTAPGHEVISCVVMKADLFVSEHNPQGWPRARFVLLRTGPRPSLIRADIELRNLGVTKPDVDISLGGRSKPTYLWKAETPEEPAQPPSS